MSSNGDRTEQANVRARGRWAGLLLLLPLVASAGGMEARPASEAATAFEPPAAAFAVAAPGDSVRLDGYTEVKGWALTSGWYFGKQRGDHSGIGFVWQDADDQVSLSTKGIRFVRRF